MGNFFDKKTEKKLQDAKSRINAITTVYNMELAKLQQSELIYADTVIKYSQLMIKRGMQEFSEGNAKENSIQSCEAYSNAEIIKYVKQKFGITIPEENALVAIDGARERSVRVFAILDRYKKAIHEAYLSFDTTLRHCSPVGGLTEISETVRENQYCNEIIKGVFAESNYEDMIHYIGRDVTGGMLAKGDTVVYPENPLASKQSSKTKMLLEKPVYMYSLDARNFTPSVTLELIHGSKEDGSSIFFPDLRFDGEWTSREHNLKCEVEEFTEVPTSVLKKSQVFYQKGKVEIDFSKPKTEFDKNIAKLYKNGKLGYLNDEFGINPRLLEDEK